MNALATETYIVERNLNIFKENVGSKYFREALKMEWKMLYIWYSHTTKCKLSWLYICKYDIHFGIFHLNVTLFMLCLSFALYYHQHSQGFFWNETIAIMIHILGKMKKIYKIWFKKIHKAFFQGCSFRVSWPGCLTTIYLIYKKKLYTPIMIII